MAVAKPNRTGPWIVLAILAVFLILAFAFLYVGWNTAGGPTDQEMSTSGYVAMTFGIIATLTLGIGLMALIFYSNRSGHDQDSNVDWEK